MPTDNNKETILSAITKRLSQTFDTKKPQASRNVIEEFNYLQNELLPIIRDIQISLFAEGKMTPKLQKMYNDIKMIQNKMQIEYAPLYNINDALQNEIGIIDQLATSLPSNQERPKKGLTSTDKMTMLMNLKKMKPEEIQKAISEINENTKTSNKPIDLTTIAQLTNTAYGTTKSEQKTQSRMIKAAYARATEIEIEEKTKAKEQIAPADSPKRR